jgi:cell division protein FtsB
MCIGILLRLEGLKMPTMKQIYALVDAYQALNKAQSFLETEIECLEESKDKVVRREKEVEQLKYKVAKCQEEVARLEALCGVKAK